MASEKTLITRVDGVQQHYTVGGQDPQPRSREYQRDDLQRSAAETFRQRADLPERIARARAELTVLADPPPMTRYERAMSSSSARRYLHGAGERAQAIARPYKRGTKEEPVAYQATVNGQPVVSLNGELILVNPEPSLTDGLRDLPAGFRDTLQQVADTAGGGPVVEFTGRGDTPDGRLVVSDFHNNRVAYYDPYLLRVAAATTGATRIDVGEFRPHGLPAQWRRPVGVLMDDQGRTVGWVSPVVTVAQEAPPA